MLLPSKNSLFHRPCVLLYTQFFFSGRWALRCGTEKERKCFRLILYFIPHTFFLRSTHPNDVVEKKKPKIMMLCRESEPRPESRLQLRSSIGEKKLCSFEGSVPCRRAELYIFFWLQVTPLWVIESESFFSRFSIFFFLLVLFWYILNSRCAVWLLLLCQSRSLSSAFWCSALSGWENELIS